MPEPQWQLRSNLTAAGKSRVAIDGIVRSGAAVPCFRGVLLPEHATGDLWQRCGAALSTQHPEAMIGRETSALVHNFPWRPDSWAVRAICVDAPREDTTRSSRRGLDRRLSAIPPEDVWSWGGLRVASIARTAIDIARYHPRGLVLPILDGLLTQERCTRAELLECVDRMVRVPHVQRARQMVGDAREGVASPRETHTRLRIIDAGLPEPDVNLLIERGQQILAQGDLGYWRWMIWIEYDGEEYHALRRFDGRDQRKDRWLIRRGWEVIRLTNEDHHSPAEFLGQLEAAIREAPARVATMDPARSPEVAAARKLLRYDR